MIISNDMLWFSVSVFDVDGGWVEYDSSTCPENNCVSDGAVNVIRYFDCNSDGVLDVPVVRGMVGESVRNMYIVICNCLQN